MKYQILLLEDITNHGRKGDVVDVAPGFARNYLLPGGKALLATKTTLKKREQLQKERSLQAVEDKKKSEHLAGQIRGMMFETIVKVDPDGHMYGSVTAVDIVEILEKYGYIVEKKSILLHQPIRQIGNAQINLRLPEGVELSIGLAVKPDREIKKQEKVQEKTETPAESTETENEESK